MELTYKIGDKDFKYLGLSLTAAFKFDQIIQVKRAILYDQESNPTSIPIDEQWIEDYFEEDDWISILNECFLLTSIPVWKEIFNMKGELAAKYQDTDFTKKDLKVFPPDTFLEIKKNLLQSMDFTSIQKKPLTVQMKLLKQLQEQQKSQIEASQDLKKGDGSSEIT